MVSNHVRKAYFYDVIAVGRLKGFFCGEISALVLLLIPELLLFDLMRICLADSRGVSSVLVLFTLE